MKIRINFVSNSSSSSFVIEKKNLSKKQIQRIHDYEDSIMFEREVGNSDPRYYQWEITEKEDTIEGYTSMDNFDFKEYLDALGIDDEDIKWDRGGW